MGFCSTTFPQMHNWNYRWGCILERLGVCFSPEYKPSENEDYWFILLFLFKKTRIIFSYFKTLLSFWNSRDILGNSILKSRLNFSLSFFQSMYLFQINILGHSNFIWCKLSFLPFWGQYKYNLNLKLKHFLTYLRFIWNYIKYLMVYLTLQTYLTIWYNNIIMEFM